MEQSVSTTPEPLWPGLTGEDENGPYLVGGRCEACGAVSLAVRAQCPQCWARDSMRVHPIGRRGTLYTSTVIHTAPSGYEAPFAVGYVDLPEGLRVFAHVAMGEDAPGIGEPVELTVVALRRDGGQPRTGPLYRSCAERSRA